MKRGKSLKIMIPFYDHNIFAIFEFSVKMTA